MRWPKYWSFSFNISPFNEHPGLISFRMDWLDLLAVQGTLKSLLQHHSSKASICHHSAFFIVQLSHPYVTTGKTTALTRWTFVGKAMSLLFNMLSRLARLAIAFLPRSKNGFGERKIISTCSLTANLSVLVSYGYCKDGLQFSGLKQHKCLIFWFRRSEIQDGLNELKSRCGQGCVSPGKHRLSGAGPAGHSLILPSRGPRFSLAAASPLPCRALPSQFWGLREAWASSGR